MSFEHVIELLTSFSYWITIFILFLYIFSDFLKIQIQDIKQNILRFIQIRT